MVVGAYQLHFNNYFVGENIKSSANFSIVIKCLNFYI